MAEKEDTVDDKNKRPARSPVGFITSTKDELSDPNKILFYTTKSLERKEGNYKCFCCSYESPGSGNVVTHISVRHPRFVHKPQVYSKGTSLLAQNRLGIKTWTEEDVADPEKKLTFTAGDVEKVDRKYKCFVCSYSSIVASAVCTHITRHHPRFIYKRSRYLQHVQNYPRRGIKTWTVEEVADPEKTLFFTTGDLEIVDGKCKCFVCSYSSAQSSDVCKHIECCHPKYVYKMVKFNRFRSNENAPASATFSVENGIGKNGNGSGITFYTVRDFKRVGSKYKCFICNYSSLFSSCVIKHVRRGHPNFIFKKIKDLTYRLEENSNARFTSNVVHHKDNKRSKNKASKGTGDTLLTSPKRRSLRNRKSHNYAESRCSSDSSSCDSDSNEEIMSDDCWDEDGRSIDTFKSDKGVFEKENDEAEIGHYYSSSERSVKPSDELETEYLFSIDRRSKEENNCLELFNGHNILVDVKNESAESPSDCVNSSSGMNEQNLDPHNVSIELPDEFQMDVDEFREIESDQQTLHISHEYKNEILRRFRAENEHLGVSIESLKTTLEVEIAVLREELGKKNEVDLNRLLCVKSELEKGLTVSHSATDGGSRGVSEILDEERKHFQNVISAQEKEIESTNRKAAERVAILARQLQLERQKIAAMEKEMICKKMECVHLKSKNEEMRRRLQCESEKTKEPEKELTKKLADAEFKLRRYEKAIELRERREKLRLEQEREELSLKKFKRDFELVLEGTKSVQEERLREMDKIQAELSLID